MGNIDYLNGRRSAWESMLRTCVNNLDRDTSHEALVLERSTTIALLRDICKEYGDNDWSDNLHLSDIIAKHLLPYMNTDVYSENPYD